MNINMNGEIVYSINVDDIQNVANQEIDRDLTADEINIIKDFIGDNIDWYNAIAYTIQDKKIV